MTSIFCDTVKFRNVFLYPTEYITNGIGWNGVHEDITPIITRPDGSKEYRISDHLASLRVSLTNGSPMQAYDYDLWGGLLSGTPTRRMFNDREEDKENSLYNNGVRKLDDGLGRFTAIDPLWEKFPWQSPYVYGDNSPITKTDPTGMQAQTVEQILKAGGGAILVLAADDVTGVGVANDALIPAVGVVTLGLATYMGVMGADAGTLPPSSQVYENMEKNSRNLPLIFPPINLSSVILEIPWFATSFALSFPRRRESIRFSNTSACLEFRKPLCSEYNSESAPAKISFPDAKELSKRFNATEKDFHKNIKPEILKQLKEFAKKIGSNNPDIGIDVDGNIGLKNPKTGKTINTDVSADSFAN